MWTQAADMTPSATPPRFDLVLVGGGHAHVTVLYAFGMRPEPGVRLTLIARELDAPYSGMLPGLIAGHYSHEQCHINLVRLARFAGARLIHGSVTGVDRAARRVLIADRPALGFDLLSIDIGITPDLSAIAGAADHALAVKPISELSPKWLALAAAAAAPGGPRRFAVAGGGAAGFELVHALAHRFRNHGGQPSFTLIAGGDLLSAVNPLARRLARASLKAGGIDLIEGDPLVAVSAQAATLASGRSLPAGAVMIATGAAAAPWFKASGLSTDTAGFLSVRATLQLRDDDDIFAAGDCAHVIDHPRERSGVYAVRQGPPLAENLRRRARGEPAVPFTPQKQALLLLATGAQHAIAARGALAVQGRWVWRWKDRIDQEFVQRFNEAPVMTGIEEADLRCGGCAAKIGPVTLSAALTRLDPSHRPEDAAIFGGGKNLRLETADYFRAFWPEPFVFGEIAAVHAMSDIHAMGGTPEHALAIAVLAHARPRLAGEDLFQLLSGARRAFDAEGVRLAGGHSSEGAELSAGFTVSGAVAASALRAKGGARAGDVLLLTKPLGTGLLFAAEMRGRLSAAALIEVLAGMRRSNGAAARLLGAHGASAMTDVTGFGLAGHLIEMLEASGAGARIGASRLPAYRDAWALARAGIASSLLPENLSLQHKVALDAGLGPEVLALAFDPQTAGGLLAALAPENAEACLKALQQGAAPDAAIIGEIVAGQAMLSIGP